MTIMENTPKLKEAKFFYDFAVDGGAQGTINLRGDDKVPAGSIVVAGYIDVLTQLASGGAMTGRLDLEGASDIVAATGVATWTAGRKNVLPAPASGSVTAATYVKTTAERGAAFVIAAADLTAGKFELVLFYR